MRAFRLSLLLGVVLTLAACNPLPSTPNDFPPRPTDTPPAVIANPTTARVSPTVPRPIPTAICCDVFSAAPTPSLLPTVVCCDLVLTPNYPTPTPTVGGLPTPTATAIPPTPTDVPRSVGVPTTTSAAPTGTPAIPACPTAPSRTPGTFLTPTRPPIPLDRLPIYPGDNGDPCATAGYAERTIAAVPTTVQGWMFSAWQQFGLIFVCSEPFPANTSSMAFYWRDAAGNFYTYSTIADLRGINQGGTLLIVRNVGILPRDRCGRTLNAPKPKRVGGTWPAWDADGLKSRLEASAAKSPSGDWGSAIMRHRLLNTTRNCAE